MADWVQIIQGGILGWILVETYHIKKMVKSLRHEHVPAATKLPKQDEMKYVGYVPHELIETRVGQKDKEYKFKTLLYMSEDGRRSYHHATQNGMLLGWLKDNEAECLAWKAGGEFPELFKPHTEDDVFAKMLNKLIDKQLTGDDE